MRNLRRPIAVTSAFVVLAGTLAAVHAAPVAADSTTQALPLTQSWTNTALLSTADDWAAVPGIVGRRGDDLTTATGADPSTILADGVLTPLAVAPNRADPDTYATGGIAEFELADPVVAMQGSGTADAPHLVVRFDTTGGADIRVRYRLRDLDNGLVSGAPVDAVQPVALHYRVGGAGNWTNVPAAYVADASRVGADFTTDVDVMLPAAANDAPLVEVRMMTANAAGTDEWIGVDDLAITAEGIATGPAAPVADCPAAVSAIEGTGGAFDLAASDADSAIASAAITSGAVPGISLDATDPAAPVLLVDPATDAGSYAVTVTFATDDAEPQTASCEIAVAVVGVVAIHDVQGDGLTSPLAGDDVVVEGIVTGTITTNDAVNGFFLQAPDADVDDDPATSEAVYVFCGSPCDPAVASGDEVRVAGRVSEFNGSTQVTAGDLAVVSSGNALPTATDVAFSDVPTTDAGAFEPVEGMLTRFTETLTVNEFFQLARFGQIELVEGDRPYTYTHVADDPTVAGNAAYLAELAARSIILEDDSDDQNDMVSGPDPNEPYPFPTPGLRHDRRFRAGDTIDDMTGVMQYAFGAWRQRTVRDVAYVFEPANPAPESAPTVDGRLTVVGFNVLNYFATIDTTLSNNVGTCGPSGTADCRGADSEAERQRQLAKMVVALRELDADVYGLTEIENDGGLATRQIVDALNAATAPGAYDLVPTGIVGTDAIKVAIIYRTTAVQPLGAARTLRTSDDPRFIDTLNRPPVIQTFEELATGERFTVAVNHLKSKGSACPGDPDTGDGAGNCNVTRTRAAEAEAAFLATDPTGSGDDDVLIIGDLNAYRNEDPIRALEDAGYTDLTEAEVGEDAYSYLFDGMLGYLDHALATPSLTDQVSGVGEWHVNADENPLFDYNDEVLDAGEATFEQESAKFPLYVGPPDQFRTSDHDPVVVGLTLASLTVHGAVIVQAPRGGGTLLLDGTVGGDLPTACPTSLTIRVADTRVDLGRMTRVGRTSTCALLTSKGLVTFDLGTGAIAGLVALTSPFRLGGDAMTIRVVVDGTSHAVVQDGRRAGLLWVAT